MISSCCTRSGVGILLATLVPAGALAGQQDRDRLSLAGAVNVVGQWAGDSEVREELVGSLDFFLDVHLGPLLLHAYVEGGSTPWDDGVSTRIPDANTDAGSALGSDGGGRVQLSEFRVSWSLRKNVVWHGGLMDLTGFLDVSRIANDENLFFLGKPFVNNPTIAFPDYVLSTALLVDVPGTSGPRFALTLSSSHGLADNPNASYDELFDVTEDRKGVFAAGSVKWNGENWRGALGGWTDSAERTRRDETESSRTSGGLFSVAGWSSGVHAVSVRLGLAGGPAAVAETFAGLTYLWSSGDNAMGLAIGRTRTSSSAAGDREHVESFLRRRVLGIVYFTGSVQWLSGFSDGVTSEPGDSVWILGFRISAAL